MPFDSLPSSPGPNVESLVAALRNLPADFRWDYSKSQTCAMGLAAMLWPEALPERLRACEHWGRVFGLSTYGAYSVFCGAGYGKNRRVREVTPDDVADVLEEQIKVASRFSSAIQRQAS